MVRLSVGAPRAVSREELKPFAHPVLPSHPYAHHFGFARDYGDASWALYGRLFVEWAEAGGIALDYFTQHDLHADPKVLEPYRLPVVVGHDEYSSWPMREAIENQLRAGGSHARFAGNNTWQVRYEDDGTMFVVGATDWVVGLQNRNWFVETITRTALDRLSGPRPSAPASPRSPQGS